MRGPAGVVLTSLVMVASANAPARADTILSGTVRDFCAPPGIPGVCAAHPDFQPSIAGTDIERGIVAEQLGADDTPVYAKGDGATSATTSGAANFAAWYHDVAGVNVSEPLDIMLNSSGSFGDFHFFPIDDRLFGDQEASHNFFFTVELHGTVTFAGDELMVASGDDDVWVFVNDRLVLDVGGAHDLHGWALNFGLVGRQMGLVPGTPYRLDVFFAERTGTGSALEILTKGVPVPEASPAWLLILGLAGLAAASPATGTASARTDSCRRRAGRPGPAGTRRTRAPGRSRPARS